MPDSIEKVLREIHLMIARSERIEGDLDRVVISKRELFSLLEELNYGLADMMDQYEMSTAAKTRAKQELLETGQEIIDTASQQAEDVYAASILYTDGALNEVYAEITEARTELRREYNKFEDKMAARLEELRANQNELMEQLRALAQGKKYFDLIEDYNKKLAEADEARKAAEKAEGGEEEDAPVIPEKFKKKTRDKDALPTIGASLEPTEPEEEEARRNLLPADEEYIWPDDTTEFAPVEIKVSSNWGTKENNVFENTTLRTKKERMREEKYGKKAKKKKSKYDFGDEEIQLTVDPEADPDAPPSFTMEDLDAEYLRWQEENGGEQEESSEPAENEKNESLDNLMNKAAEMFGFKKKK